MPAETQNPPPDSSAFSCKNRQMTMNFKLGHYLYDRQFDIFQEMVLQ